MTSSVSGKRSPAELIALVLAEVETGFEPVYTALQAVASPLGHSTEEVRLWRPRADDGTRTRDPHLGKVMRYQLRYVRTAVAESIRATDENSSRGLHRLTNRIPLDAPDNPGGAVLPRSTRLVGAGQEPSRSSARRSGTKRISSKVTAQPSPVGDWASRPISSRPGAPSVPPRVKKRIIRQRRPSSEAWYA